MVNQPLVNLNKKKNYEKHNSSIIKYTKETNFCLS